MNFRMEPVPHVSTVMQLKAQLVKNFTLKMREKQKTLAEIFLSLYTIVFILIMKTVIPNTDYPKIDTTEGGTNIFAYFSQFDSQRIAVVPDTSETRNFMDKVNSVWIKMNYHISVRGFNINYYNATEESVEHYLKGTDAAVYAVIFESNPLMDKSLRYEIRINPSFATVPSASELYEPAVACRGSERNFSMLRPIDGSQNCHVNQYYYSGFVALQTLIDYTKIKEESKDKQIMVPNIYVDLYPKPYLGADLMMTYLKLIPLYMVISYSNLINYLLGIIVGEKEKKIKEGMKIMGLRNFAYWLGWFLVYAVIVTFLSFVNSVLLFVLGIFQHSSFLLIFILIDLYGLSVVMIAFMITPFFNKARTAGILGNFAVNLIGMLYFIQVFVDTNSRIMWFISLLSPPAFASALYKAILTDTMGHPVHLLNDHIDGIPLCGTFIMLTVDILIYGFLAFYLDSVVPSEYGTKHKPCFICSSKYWCLDKTSKISSDEECDTILNNEESDSDHIEPVPQELKEHAAIKMTNLCKTYKSWMKPEVKALNGINLTIYEGHITAILGPNGAGKTTIFNILTGLVAPTEGNVCIFGRPITNAFDMGAIRSTTGFCPQFDELYDSLTPKEHLAFYAQIKGQTNVDVEVNNILADVGLVEQAHTITKELSGGQKRKLSVGIAIIGDPKLIILDEPTAGMDPHSKRHLWSVLQNRKQGKVILLTTHFMDEADILADRKAIIISGHLKCCGSSLFLKNRFGIGYNLKLIINNNNKLNTITNFVKTYIPDAKYVSERGHEIAFILPHERVDTFARLFSAIEQAITTKSNFGIESYGVSMTTLEEVFLRLEHEDNTECENNKTDVLKNTAKCYYMQAVETPLPAVELNECNISNEPMKEGKGEPFSEDCVEDTEYNSGCISNVTTNSTVLIEEANIKNPKKSSIMYVMLHIRMMRLIREKQQLIVLILFPLIFATLGLYANSLQVIEPVHKLLVLNADVYGENTRIIVINKDNNTILNHLVSELSPKIQVDWFDGSYASLLDTKVPHIAAINFTNCCNLSNISFKVICNDTAQHSLPVTLSLISGAVYRMMAATDKVDKPTITVKSYPFQQSLQPEFKVETIISSVLLGMIFVLTPVSLATDMVHDREIKAKCLLQINGMPLFIYFCSFFIVLACIMALISASLLVLVYFFDLPSFQEPVAFCALAVMIMTYCPSSILFTMCLSYLFDRMVSAQGILPNLVLWFGMIPFIIVVAMDFLHIGEVVLIMHTVFSAFVPMYIPYAIIYFVGRVSVIYRMNPNCQYVTASDFMNMEIIIMFISMLVQIPLCFCLLVVLDTWKSGRKISDLVCRRRQEIKTSGEDGDADSDSSSENENVTSERIYVKALINSCMNNPPPILIHNLRKEYHSAENVCDKLLCKVDEKCADSKVAVRSLSLAVHSGEIFGLLGHNGAGKTTTMKLMTTEEAPTRGTVRICGHDVTTNMKEVFQLMGYCPQQDALWKNITVKEHLRLYALLRGIPLCNVDRLINLYIRGIQMKDHCHKRISECSGGTKRKVSFTISVIGNPYVVLLDEPSCGMDATSKRFLWNNIMCNFQQNRGAVLTTHSMEEADKLCNRVGIMRKGNLICIGSTQDLKNLYGGGYTLELKMKIDHQSQSSSSTDKLSAMEYLKTKFPSATLEESFSNRLVYRVPQWSIKSLAKCFEKLQAAKMELAIEEYSFSQTTLEQVYLKFAQATDEVDNSEHQQSSLL